MMSSNLYQSLAWLPRTPADFSSRCRALLDSADDLGHRLQALANHALDENQLHRVAQLIAGARKKQHSLQPLVPFRLGVLSNATTDFVLPALTATAARHGIDLHGVASGYAQAMQEALSPESAVHRAKPDAVLIALDYRGFALHSPIADKGAADARIQDALAQVQAIRDGIHAHSNAIGIVQNLAAPAEVLFGSLDQNVPGSLRYAIDGVNRGLAESVAGSQDIVLDIAGLAATIGLAEWHSPEQWNLAKLPFSSSYLPLYADHVARSVAALRGKSRRVLVMDLDNTLWGGVIGDDGVEGIQLAQGDPTGEAFLSVQRYALALRERGVVLAVSSKNNDEVARAPFRKHPEMLLREEHLAIFQANWEDKATNIKALADELGLGLESLVFLDDNPAERAIVRQFLPQVAVPELPDDPALYVRTLSAAGYFEAVTLSAEDLQRAEFYQNNAARVAIQRQFADIESYLASLEMVITFSPFDETSRPRITQLINKSNQYNLTTHRYSEAEVAQIERDANCFALQVRLADKFGDNGMISVAICRRHADSWEIDTWLMSCRVMGRRVENMLLREIAGAARREGIATLRGRYIPTERNVIVADHYAKLGFVEVRREASGESLWELDLAGAHIESAPMQVRYVNLPVAESAHV